MLFKNLCTQHNGWLLVLNHLVPYLLKFSIHNLKFWRKSWLVSESRRKSCCGLTRWWFVPRLPLEYLLRSVISFINIIQYSFRNKIRVLTSIFKQIFSCPVLCNPIYCQHKRQGVILIAETTAISHPGTQEWQCYYGGFVSGIRGDIAIAAIDSGRKNVAHVIQRPESSFKSRLMSLKWVSKIFHFG